LFFCVLLYGCALDWGMISTTTKTTMMGRTGALAIRSVSSRHPRRSVMTTRFLSSSFFSSSSYNRPEYTTSSSTTSTADASLTSSERMMIQQIRDQIVPAAIRAVDPRDAVRKHMKVAIVNTDQNYQIIDPATIPASLSEDPYYTPPTSSCWIEIENMVYDWEAYDDIVIVGFGKAAVSMAMAVLEQLQVAHFHYLKTSTDSDPILLQDRLNGLIITKEGDGHVTDFERAYLLKYGIEVREVSHPIPQVSNVVASRDLLEHVQTSTNAWIIVVGSGGGSALFCTPAPGISLSDLQRTHQLLVQHSGWNIRDMNTVRQVLEIGKGGGLARAMIGSKAFDNDMVAFLLSDVAVEQDDLRVIASGPTVLDSPENEKTKFTRAWKLIQSFQQQHPETRKKNNEIEDGDENDSAFPEAVIQYIQEGCEKELAAATAALTKPIQSTEEGGADGIDTDAYIREHCQNVLVATNAQAVQAAAIQCQELGYAPVILGTRMAGSSAQLADIMVEMARQTQNNTCSPEYKIRSKFPVALLAGGETTVEIPASQSSGLGGRNQHFALSAALTLDKYRLRNIVVAGVATDGTDGPTDAAGGIVDGGTVRRLDPRKDFVRPRTTLTLPTAEQAWKNFDSYGYLKRTDSYGNSPLLKVCLAQFLTYI
jgi:glycerate-2-kinase